MVENQRNDEQLLLLTQMIQELQQTTKLEETKKYVQHGCCTVYDHCISVAVTSVKIAARLNLQVDYRALIRGALLHDYFLYDWHENHPEYGLHGFTHARTACENASRDVALTEKEKDIILHHMFPLNLMPPSSKEAWLICLADKICASKETWKGMCGVKKRAY